jgi:hypothetical protein
MYLIEKFKTNIILRTKDVIAFDLYVMFMWDTQFICRLEIQDGDNYKHDIQILQKITIENVIL